MLRWFLYLSIDFNTGCLNKLPELPLSLDPSVTCAKYCVQYKKNEKWLKCTMCDQWFHEKYFYM